MAAHDDGSGLEGNPGWEIHQTYRDSGERRRSDTLFTLGSGGYVTGGAPEDAPLEDTPGVLVSGVYTGTGAEQDLLEGPNWSRLDVTASPAAGWRRLDLHSGVLSRQELDTDQPVRTVRFVSTHRPGVMALRAEGPAERLHPGSSLSPPAGAGSMAEGNWGDDRRWARTGNGDEIAAVAQQHCTQQHGRRMVERIVAYSTEGVDAAGVKVDSAQRKGFDQLLVEHRAVWADRWQTVNVHIPDDPDLELAARFALFQLWCNVGGRTEAAVGARGVSGHGYAGHVLWDAEVFVLPAIVSMDPALALAMIDYRLNRMGPARAAARATECRGVRFPWESAASGYDVTPKKKQIGRWWVDVKTGQLEEHITADVAWSVWHYAQWTGKESCWQESHRDLLLNTARYWASRIRVDSTGRAHIDNVIGPDEYHVSVSDNVFTNVMARWNLYTAAELADGPESTEFRDLAAKIVDGYDPTRHVYEQFGGYFDRELLTADDIEAAASNADALLGPDRVNATQLVKQPDVLMLYFLVPEELVPGSLGPNLDFYLPRTTHGSSLSPGVHACLLARCHRPDEAVQCLRPALRADLDHYSGSPGGGLHLAAMGSAWEALLFGFAGARVRNGVLHLDPVLPTGWGSLGMQFRCLGRRIRLQITREGSAVAVHVEVDGAVQVCLAGAGTHEVTEQDRLYRVGSTPVGTGDRPPVGGSG